jgi:hypothetical protein
MERRIRVSSDTVSTMKEIRKVWKILTLSKGNKTCREIACEIRTSKTRVSHIIQYLERLGHIKRIPRSKFITVNIPFVEILNTQ